MIIVLAKQILFLAKMNFVICFSGGFPEEK